MTDSSQGASGFRMRFEFRLSTPLNHADGEFSFLLGGRSAVLQTIGGKPLSEDERLVLNVRGFGSEHEALDFGHRAQPASLLAAIEAGMGIDVGQNKPRLQSSEAIKEAIRAKGYGTLRDRIHGVDAFLDDEDVFFLSLDASGRVLVPIEKLTGHLVDFFEVCPTRLSGRVERGVRLRAEARVARDPLAAFVLAVTSVEALTDDPPWSSRQEQMLAHAASALMATGDASQQEIEEVAQRIRTLHKVGVMQGFKRLLVTLDRLNLWPRWKRLYSETRSAFLHGDKPQAIDGDAIHEAMTLSKEIVLAAARLEIDRPAGGLASTD
jgi:hypothetical protein